LCTGQLAAWCMHLYAWVIITVTHCIRGIFLLPDEAVAARSSALKADFMLLRGAGPAGGAGLLLRCVGVAGCQLMA